MTERSGSPEHEQDEQPLDRELIVGRMQELGVEIGIEDFDGEDDNDVLGIIATYAAMYDFDIDEILRKVIPTDEDSSALRRGRIQDVLNQHRVSYDAEMLGAWATDEQVIEYLLSLGLDNYGIGLEDLVV